MLEPFLHWLAVHTGTLNESGPYYGFWSGFGSDLGELTLVGAIMASTYHAARLNNCEHPRCWRIGRHKTNGGHRVCKHHHPSGPPTAKDIADAHNAASS